jgi:hypothetical protein
VRREALGVRGLKAVRRETRTAVRRLKAVKRKTIRNKKNSIKIMDSHNIFYRFNMGIILHVFITPYVGITPNGL